MDQKAEKNLCFYYTDGVSRNLIRCYIIRQEMADSNKFRRQKGIHAANDSIENMLLSMMNEIPLYKNKTFADRSKVGKFEKVKLNFWRGFDSPFGGKIQKMAGGSILVFNLEESKWVEFMVAEYINGTPLRRIKDALESKKVKT
jgi:hypothetical protein